MGSILNRSIFVAIITYAGVAIGYFNLLWLFPKVMDLEQLGLFRVVQDTAFLLVPFTQLGAGQGLIRFFPYGANKEEKQQLVSFALFWSLLCFLVFALMFWLMQDWFYNIFDDKAQAVNDFLPVILLLTLILNFQSILEPLSRSLLKFKFVAFGREVLLRLLTTLLVIAYYFGLISFGQGIWGLIAVYGIVTLAIAIYMISAGWSRLSFRFSPSVRQYMRPFLQFGFISFLSSASSMLIMKTDILMITSMIGLEANGIYSIVFYMAVLVELPRRTLSQISTPLLAQAFEQQNMGLAQRIYQKSSINLLLVGGLLFIGIVCNMDSLFSFIPKGDAFKTGAIVVVLIGLGKVIDGAAGVNGEILSMSRYYQVNLYFTLLMAAINVVLNYQLIPIMGIGGAALASCLSLVVFNLLKFLHIWYTLKLQPFSAATLILCGILALAFAAGWYMPAMSNPFLDIILRSLLITGLVALGVLSLNISEEADSLFQKMLSFVRRS